jgi:hypothetical protein
MTLLELAKVSWLAHTLWNEYLVGHQHCLCFSVAMAPGTHRKPVCLWVLPPWGAESSFDIMLFGEKVSAEQPLCLLDSSQAPYDQS